MMQEIFTEVKVSQATENLNIVCTERQVVQLHTPSDRVVPHPSAEHMGVTQETRRGAQRNVNVVSDRVSSTTKTEP